MANFKEDGMNYYLRMRKYLLEVCCNCKVQRSRFEGGQSDV